MGVVWLPVIPNNPRTNEMSVDTLLGIVGAVLFIAGLTTYLKIKRNRIKLVSFGIIVASIILIAIAIVGLPA
jgi:lipopolysaccharide export LptBFGC system permease protein LptF